MTDTSLIYLDHAATTPLDERVLQAMLPFLRGAFGNAASRQHAMGRAAAVAVEVARRQLAALIHADPREIVFMSGATEANNLALKGVANAAAYEGEPRRMLSCVTEHHAVLDPLRGLAQESGFEVVHLKVDSAGHIDLDELRTELARGVRLVSLMHVNNEIGTLHPIAEIGALCREHGALFHTDATQAAGKVPIDVDAMHVDLLSFSAHKLYGPKGVGALYLRRKRPRVRCRALIDGGGHERGMRSGTLNVPGIVGFGAAAEICTAEMGVESERLDSLAQLFLSELAPLPDVQRNGAQDSAQRLPGILNLSFAGVDAESLLSHLVGVAASSSSACTSASLQPSHVLRALGAAEERVDGSVRFSLGRGTSADEVRKAAAAVLHAVERERRDGPHVSCPE